MGNNKYYEFGFFFWIINVQKILQKVYETIIKLILNFPADLIVFYTENNYSVINKCMDKWAYMMVCNAQNIREN